MRRLKDLLPQGLALGDLSEHWHSVAVLNGQMHEVGIIAFEAGFELELFVGHDLYKLFHARRNPAPRDESVRAQKRNVTPRESVETWWNAVLNTPVTIGLGNEIHIDTGNLIGYGQFYRGILTCFSCFSAKPSIPKWRIIRYTRPDLRTSLGE